ncbi:12260_t:CDS:2, partial [Gigaspora rosea]
MARARNDCTKHATATRVLQIQNMSSQLTLQQIQIPRQMQYFQQISTNPNMVQPLQTPNILHVQIPQQMNNGLVMQSLNQQQQMEKQQIIPQQCLSRFLKYAATTSQTTPSQMNNQFTSYGLTQWQQQPNVA